MRRYPFSLLVLLLLCGEAWAGIVDSRHNLSISGPGDIKVTGETQVCIFCHTRYDPEPQAPAWNLFSGGTTYIPYTSSTLKAYPGQPSGSSLLCLSCHDGTTAMGELAGQGSELSLQLAMRELSNRSSNVGTDLTDDHPISLYYYDSYSADPAQYVDPGALTGRVRLDETGQVQCTSCHDPHDDTLGNFLVKSLDGGELCLTCHTPRGWSESAHAGLTEADATSIMAGRDSATRRAACRLCHTSHAADGVRLLLFDNEENNCFDCHNSQLPGSDMEREFGKLYRHPVVETIGVHDPVEPAIVEARHVECVDCHNPHATQQAATAGDGNDTNGNPSHMGPLADVAGVSLSGAAIDAATGVNYTYEVCFRCHGDSDNQPAPIVRRTDNETNLRVDLSPTNRSYHPVTAPGVNLDVPSLIEPYTVTSQIGCDDCHGNDDDAGPRGPHGSRYQGLLKKENRTQFPTPESPSAYRLCYSCHDRNSILADESFPTHNLHVTGGGSKTPNLQTPCSVCHDPHGSQSDALINFDISVVQPSADGRREFFSAGPGAGGCYLACHGADHNPLYYGGK